jgi:hypothetical protein
MLCHPEESSDEGSAVAFHGVGLRMNVGHEEAEAYGRSKNNRGFLTAFGMTAGFMLLTSDSGH